MSDLAQALMVAIRVHANQRDKQGEPYLLHVLRVVETVSDEVKVVAALHDVLEDSPEHNRLGARALDVKLQPREVLAVELLNRAPGTAYSEYISQIARPLETLRVEELDRKWALRAAREVKLADLRDNLGRIPAREDAWEEVEMHMLSGEHGPVTLDLREEWDRTWASLKKRYERAIEVLSEASA